MSSNFEHSIADIPPSISFPEEEENILAYWTDIRAFEKSVELSEGKEEYTFYDGPPFATGLPHYGHILGFLFFLFFIFIFLVPPSISLSSSSFTHSWHHQGLCHSIRSPDRPPRRSSVRLGLPRPARRVRD